MSLTNFLESSKDVRHAMRDIFPYICKQAAFPPLQAPPFTTNYTLVGQAFDYLLRFYIQRNNPAASQHGRWIAEHAGHWASIDEGGHPTPETTAIPYLEQAHAHHEIYLRTGEVTDDLLRSCFDLAMMDGVYRAGELRGQLGHIDLKDIQDLRNLLALVPPTPFLDGNPCFLNPSFRFPGGGADCDLFLGETLIEIKTTKNAKLERKHVDQLLGYYLINLSESNRLFTVKHIGIYFSRHGYLWSVPIEIFGRKITFQQFLPVWNEHVRRYNSSDKEHQPAQRLKDLIAQGDRLAGSSQYSSWLSQLSDIDFLTWKVYATTPFYTGGTIEIEEEKRNRRHT